MSKIWYACPKCGCEDITAGFLDCDGETASREVECLKCYFTWVEVFDFSHNANVEYTRELDDDGNEIPLTLLK
jgi:predicted nucleic-acid-binding Zn-ribbon protein